jgi:threonine dehydrogenase-like Zn-dependent dehydrogenase
MKMKGVVPVGGYKVEVRDIDIAEPAEGEVLINVKCAGICGSDVNTFRMTWEQIGERQNLVVGHEAGGIVEKVGPGVRKIKPGDRICVYHYMGCGKCKYCEAGIVGMCEQKRAYGWHVHGAMSEFLITEERSCRILPAEIPFEDSTFMACSAGTAFASIKKLDNFSSNGYLAVVGMGPIGLVSSLMAMAKGWKVIAFDTSENRVEFAKSRNIHAFCPDKAVPLKDQLRGKMNDRLPVRVLDTSGHPEGLADALDIVEKKGFVVTIGKGRRTYAMSQRVDISEIVVKETTLQGSWVFTIPDYEELVEFMIDNKLTFQSLITGRFAFGDAQKAFEKAADLSNAGKTVFVKP